MKRFLLVGALLFFSMLCFYLSYIAIKNDEIISGSEIEISSTPVTGQITWYTSIPQSHAERIAGAFKLKYRINVIVVRSSTFLIRQRLFSEITNNTINADVLTIADVGTYIELENRDLLFNYPSPQLQNFPEKFKRSGSWAVFAGFGICMAFHKHRVHSPPKSWADLLDAKWKGRIGLEDINTAGSQYGQYFMLRQQLGVDFWKRLLSSQRPKIYYKTEALANALIEGEIDVAGQFSIHTVYDYKINRNTPIEGIYPSEGIPFIFNPVAIIKLTRNLKEAKVFFDYLLSEDGQITMQQLNFKYSVRRNILPLRGIPALNELNLLLPINEKAYLKSRMQYIQEYNRFFSGVGDEDNGQSK